MDQDATWYGGVVVGFGPCHIVLDRHPASFRPQERGHSPPIFGLCLLWSNGWMDQDSRCHLVHESIDSCRELHKAVHSISRPIRVYSDLSRVRGSASPVLTATGLVNGRWQFSAQCNVAWAQPRPRRHCVGDPAPQKRTQQPPVFGPCLLWPNGWMDQDSSWYGGRPRPRPRCVIWRATPFFGGGHTPNFRSMSVVVKRLDELGCHLVWR